MRVTETKEMRETQPTEDPKSIEEVTYKENTEVGREICREIVNETAEEMMRMTEIKEMGEEELDRIIREEMKEMKNDFRSINSSLNILSSQSTEIYRY